MLLNTWTVQYATTTATVHRCDTPEDTRPHLQSFNNDKENIALKQQNWIVDWNVNDNDIKLNTVSYAQVGTSTNTIVATR